MATFASVKNRANSNKTLSLILLLLFLGALVGELVWTFLANWKLAFLAGGVTTALLSGWWFYLLWQSNNTWLCRVQTILSSIGVLPQDYSFTDKAVPWDTQSRLDAATRAAAEMVQESSKKLAANRHALEKYLGSQASRHAAEGVSGLELGGKLQPVFILFSDIRGFTSMTEKLTAQETMRVLNQMYSSMGSVIEGAGGEINKFIGDAILAYFKRSEAKGADEAERVVRAALQMQENFLKVAARNSDLKAKSIQIGLGIGIVAGEAILGNLGSRSRMEFTLIGDSVNLASRLCGIAPENEVLVNEELAMLVKEKFHIESRMPVQLKGKTGKTIPYCVMGDLSHLSLIQPLRE
jgi:class 3 adenylate cyclase